MKFISDIMTSADNATFSMSKLIALAGVLTACYEFVYKHSANYQEFLLGIAGIIGALAAKTFTDKRNDTGSNNPSN